MMAQNNNLVRIREILQALLPQGIVITHNSMIFLDIDDVILEPPLKAITKICKEDGLNPPTRDQIVNRNHIDWFHLIAGKTPKRSEHWRWLFKGYWDGACFQQSLFPEHDYYSLREVLKSHRIIFLTRLPSIFASQRKQFLEQFFRIDLTGRFMACGPFLGQGLKKAEIIRQIMKKHYSDISQCYLIDDNPAEITAARSSDIQAIVVDRPWNQAIESPRIGLKDLVAFLETLLVEGD